MYDLLDRPIQSLRPFERTVLSATRRWVHALTVAGPAATPIEDPAFHDVMELLERRSTDTLVLQRPCHPVVEETEAVLLGLWRLVRADRLGAAHGLACTLVDRASAGRLISSIMAEIEEID